MTLPDNFTPEDLLIEFGVKSKIDELIFNEAKKGKTSVQVPSDLPMIGIAQHYSKREFSILEMHGYGGNETIMYIQW